MGWLRRSTGPDARHRGHFGDAGHRARGDPQDGRPPGELARRRPLLRHRRPLRRRRSPTTTRASTATPRGPSTAATSRGCAQQLDEIADLGVTALWITPVVKNIDGFVTGAGFPDWGYHGYWADDFHAARSALRHRGGAARRLVDEAHARGMQRAARRGLQPRRATTRSYLDGPARPRAGCAPRTGAPAARTT